MIYGLIDLVRRVREIIRTEGPVSLFRRAFNFVKPYLWDRGVVYLYEHELLEKNETDFLPKTQGLVVKIVSSNEEADALAAEGLEFRSRFIDSRRKLDRGAIALCLFVGGQIAHISWMGLTKAAKSSFDRLPYQVDFSKGEAAVGGTVTVPEYKGLGLMGYGIFKKFEFLRQHGITRVRHAVSVDNMASRKPYQKFEYRIYSKAKYIKVLCWQFWKEVPLAPDEVTVLNQQ